MEDWKLGYLAGMIDGEGSLSILKAKRSYPLVLRIANTDLKIINFLHQNFGGTVYNASYGEERRKPCYSLQWSGQKAKEILLLVFGQLQGKTEKAGLFIGFPFMGQGGGNTYSKRALYDHEEIKKAQENLYLAMKELNK